MKIAFVSVRGIPNNYGGFEQFAEYISVGLVKRGHEVTVYSPSGKSFSSFFLSALTMDFCKERVLTSSFLSSDLKRG